jgi:SET domain-containing protein
VLHSTLFIADATNRGRGVFTEEALPAGLLLEESPVIVMPPKDRPLLDQTLLHDYIFEWNPGEEKACCMALGWVPLYNHSYASNCEYEMDYDAQVMRIHTVRAVAAGEELTINYNGDWNDAAPVWFKVE